MVREIDGLFEKLKKTGPLIRDAKPPDTLFFRMTPESRDVTLKVIDGNDREVAPEYEFYSGHVRQILKEIARLKEKQAFTIDWGETETETETTDELIINGNDYLVSLLVQSPLFVDDQGERILLAEGEARVRVTIEPHGQEIATTVSGWYDRKPVGPIIPVTEFYVLSGGKMFRVKPLGRNFQALSLFEARLGIDAFEQYLTMLFSTLSNVDVDYNGYTTRAGTPKTTRPTLIFEKISRNNALYMRVSASYPGYSPDFFDNFDVDRLVTVNDLEKKIIVSPLVHGEITDCFKKIHMLLKKHAKSLKEDNAIYVHDNFMIIESALAARFITRELPGLLSAYTLMGTEKLKSYRVKYVQPRMELTLNHGIDFLEGDAVLDLAGEQFSLNDVLAQYRKNSYVKLSDGTSAVMNPDYMEKLERIFKKGKTGVKVSFFDLPIVEELIGEKVAVTSFKQSRDIFLGFNRLDGKEVVLPPVNAVLRGYQKQGFTWLFYLYTHQLGGCLADDMGLGKTIQTITLLADIYPGPQHASLIIMPKTLLFNWECELKKFAPQLSFYCYYGTQRDMDLAMTHHIVLTTYAMVRNDIEVFQPRSFHMVVLDESQNIKNLNAKVSKAVMLLNTSHRLALSGTPMENNLGELYALFRFLNPSMFGTFSDFSRNYLYPIQKADNKTVVKELRKKIYPFILRRLKSDVLKELPERVEQTLYVDMSPEQKEFYHQRRVMYRNAIKEQIREKGLQKARFFILQALGELRQIASIPESKSDHRIISPKREILMEHVNDAVAGGHKVLVFANYLQSLECVSQDMDAAGIDHLVMTGSTRDRSKVVNQFQTDDQCMALLMTLKTGGLGLNLTSADYVFLFDPWWNVAAENQAIDRAHRMGQKNTVFSYRLITRESIEEKILTLQEKKRALFDALISSDDASIKKLDEADIDFVLQS